MSTQRNPDHDKEWDYTCDECGFSSLRHPTKASAEERGAEHEAEHEGADPADLAQPVTE